MKGTGVFLLASIMMVFLSGLALAQQPQTVVFKTDINFKQEQLARPATGLPATGEGVGAGVFVLSADRTKLDYAITFVGLSGPALVAHFHSPGNFGESVGVVKDICGPCPDATIISGTWSTTDTRQALTPTDIDNLLKGRVYVNLHTGMNPGGEVRGQVIPITAK